MKTCICILCFFLNFSLQSYAQYGLFRLPDIDIGCGKDIHHWQDISPIIFNVAFNTSDIVSNQQPVHRIFSKIDVGFDFFINKKKILIGMGTELPFNSQEFIVPYKLADGSEFICKHNFDNGQIYLRFGYVFSQKRIVRLSAYMLIGARFINSYLERENTSNNPISWQDFSQTRFNGNQNQPISTLLEGLKSTSIESIMVEKNMLSTPLFVQADFRIAGVALGLGLGYSLTWGNMKQNWKYRIAENEIKYSGKTDAPTQVNLNRFMVKLNLSILTYKYR